MCSIGSGQNLEPQMATSVPEGAQPGSHCRNLQVSGRLCGGQGRGRTAGLSIFRRLFPEPLDGNSPVLGAAQDLHGAGRLGPGQRHNPDGRRCAEGGGGRGQGHAETGRDQVQDGGPTGPFLHDPRREPDLQAWLQVALVGPLSGAAGKEDEGIVA